MFFSEHSGGAAYEYAVVEKIGKRVNSVCAATREARTDDLHSP